MPHFTHLSSDFTQTCPSAQPLPDANSSDDEAMDEAMDAGHTTGAILPDLAAGSIPRMHTSHAMQTRLHPMSLQTQVHGMSRHLHHMSLVLSSLVLRLDAQQAREVQALAHCSACAHNASRLPVAPVSPAPPHTDASPCGADTQGDPAANTHIATHSAADTHIATPAPERATVVAQEAAKGVGVLHQDERSTPRRM
mmetsp:Transcript_24164/g.35418  ORF Transcript_24164/g.35418 Transcript_24164/m.35418 type:complete len:196 (+) Transcript_24164:3-590(+)